MQTLKELAAADDARQALEAMLKLPGHMDFVRIYRDIPAKMTQGQASEKDLVTVQSSLDEIEAGSDQNTRDNGDKGVQK